MTDKLPINIDDLLRLRMIEGERVEYKAGWNAPAVPRTVESDEDRTSFLVRLPLHAQANSDLTEHETEHVAGQVTEHETGHETEQATEHVERLVAALIGEMNRPELQAALKLSHRPHFLMAYLRPAIEAGLIEMTCPDKPTSRKQRYRRTAAGEVFARQLAQQTAGKVP